MTQIWGKSLPVCVAKCLLKTWYIKVFMLFIESRKYTSASDLGHNGFFRHKFAHSTFTRNSGRNNLLYVKVTENLWHFLGRWPRKELCGSCFFMIPLSFGWRQWIGTDDGPNYAFFTQERDPAKPGLRKKDHRSNSL